MPNPNRQKINRLLRTIRNPNVSEQRKNSALQELEGEVNQYATSQEKRFNASLSSFEQQWQRFEESNHWLTTSLDSSLSSDVDPDEVNLLMQQIQDEIRLERAYPPSVPSDEELERRLQKLREFVPPKPTQRTVVDPLDELEQLVDEMPSFELDFTFLDDINDSILDTEIQIEHLEDELDAIPDVGNQRFEQTIVSPTPSDRVSSAPKNNVTPSIDRPASITMSMHNAQPVDQQPSPPKSSAFSRFLKSVGSFLQSAANFFKQLGSGTVSLEGAIDNLKKANKELRIASSRLSRAQDRLSKAVETVQTKQRQLTTLNSEYQQVAKKLRIQTAALQKLQSSSDMDPQKKAAAIKKMRTRIAETRKDYNQKSGAIQQLSSQLKRASSLAINAHSHLKESTEMHKEATNAVKKGVVALENASEKQQKNIDKQHHIKDLLQSSKAKYKQAEEKHVSAKEDSGETFKFN